MPVKLINKTPGDPVAVLRTEDYEMPEPDMEEVLIQMIAAAVNPVDINIIQGKYPLTVDYLGYEGVGKVIKVGSGVQKLKVGDHVIPIGYGGTWRTHFTLSEEDVLYIPKEIDIPDAATLFVNPVSVYVMLTSYVKLEPGNTLIQNGANSACGVVAIQMCKSWGINTVNIVRDRPNIAELKFFLKELGASYVFTEEEIKKTDIFKTGELNNPVLALNCIGGESANNLIRHLNDEGILVTYGGMSLEPVRVSTAALVFRNIRLEGVNIARWMNNENNRSKLPKIFQELIDMVLKGTLKAPPYVLVDFLSYMEAMKNTLSKGGMIGRKYILDFRTPASKI